MATISDTFLMIPREFTTLVKVAYKLKYKDDPVQGNFFVKIFKVIGRVFKLIGEILNYEYEGAHQDKNVAKLTKDFSVIEADAAKSTKPICLYVIGSEAYDHNGAILGNTLYYYHHYKIQKLQKHFAVFPKLVGTASELRSQINGIREQFPTREIKVIDIVAHGDENGVYINDNPFLSIHQNNAGSVFEGCESGITIILDSCNTGTGEDTIAEAIAEQRPGVRVLAPESFMFFSKPVVKFLNGVPEVVSMVHGGSGIGAFFNASTGREFKKEPAVQTEAVAI